MGYVDLALSYSRATNNEPILNDGTYFQFSSPYATQGTGQGITANPTLTPTATSAQAEPGGIATATSIPTVQSGSGLNFSDIPWYAWLAIAAVGGLIMYAILRKK